MASVIRRFEIDPFKALDYMVSRGALRSDPSSIAKFLFNTSELNRRQLGRFLGDTRNGNLARAFMDRFSWSNLSIDHSLRALFMSLRLPGEAQPADQILDHFSVAWHAANEEFINFDLELAQNLITVLMSLS
ncbi:SEC7-like protein, partial [Conidiobolus coronatus NRRL 28638]